MQTQKARHQFDLAHVAVAFNVPVHLEDRYRVPTAHVGRPLHLLPLWNDHALPEHRCGSFHIPVLDLSCLGSEERSVEREGCVQKLHLSTTTGCELLASASTITNR